MADHADPAGQLDRRHDDYERIAHSEQFQLLRRRYLRFAGPAVIAFMVWYVTYVLANNWARGFMGTRVVGHVNVALVFGLLQFVSTFVIAYAYARHAHQALDPIADELRADFESRDPGRTVEEQP
ncbi:MAG: DUF485 domain-containing protein [Propionibacteriaceae bacterium]